MFSRPSLAAALLALAASSTAHAQKLLFRVYDVNDRKVHVVAEEYKGTLDLKRYRPTATTSHDHVALTWKHGKTKVYGVGFVLEFTDKSKVKKRYLIAAAGPGESIVGQHLRTVHSGGTSPPGGRRSRTT